MEILIKTFKEEDLQYAINLLEKGDLYFQHVTVYQSIEDNDVRGDKGEGKVVEKLETPNTKRITLNGGQGKQFILDLEQARKAVPSLAGKKLGSFVVTYEVDWLIYCMTYLNTDTINLDDSLHKIKQFGKYCVVIIDGGDLMAKLNSKTEICEAGLINYLDSVDPNPFIKRSCYEWQHEYRIGIAANGAMYKLISVGKLKGFICESTDLKRIKNTLRV